MPEDAEVTINVIFPIGQNLYDAVMEQVASAGGSLDALYSDACADVFAHVSDLEQPSNRALRLFHHEEL